MTFDWTYKVGCVHATCCQTLTRALQEVLPVRQQEALLLGQPERCDRHRRRRRNVSNVLQAAVAQWVHRAGGLRDGSQQEPTLCMQDEYEGQAHVSRRGLCCLPLCTEARVPSRYTMGTSRAHHCSLLALHLKCI